jgi:hypothetical protein
MVKNLPKEGGGIICRHFKLAPLLLVQPVPPLALIGWQRVREEGPTESSHQRGAAKLLVSAVIPQRPESAVISIEALESAPEVSEKSRLCWHRGKPYTTQVLYRSANLLNEKKENCPVSPSGCQLILYSTHLHDQRPNLGEGVRGRGWKDTETDRKRQEYWISW